MVFVLFLNNPVVAKDKSETQVSSLGELVTMFDSSSCKECHEQIYAQWEKSHHARPLMGLNDQIFIAGYLKRGPLAVKPGENAAKSNFPCFKCHFPQIKYATDAVAAE
ncbi:MAG: multiheme c-type cytochrome, partial [Deltaproteobacteria bacterium]|nr:multiheme c-type cytochrome [Deltaproteobacteria bacterium]